VDEFDPVRYAQLKRIVSSQPQPREIAIDRDDCAVSYPSHHRPATKEWLTDSNVNYSPLSQVFANSMVLPPTPQNASMMTSHLHLSAMCLAIGCGVMENQPVWSRRRGSWSY
jgi:hypothetical protein